MAAGFGTRLLPHTELKPKPLFPILNKPLLLLTIKRLQNFGFDRIIVNCHHLKEQIVDQLQGIEGVIIQEEDIILGTGGGLRRALGEMKDEPLLVTNGDIYHTIDYGKLYIAHQQNQCPATLAMHHYPRFNSVDVFRDRIMSFSNEKHSAEKLAFTGLYVIDPAILQGIKDGVTSCIVDSYRNLIQEGETLGVYRVDDCYWTDMGTPEDYLALHEGLLTQTIPCWPELDYFTCDPILVSDDACLTGNYTLANWASIGRIIGRNVNLSQVVVWDDVELYDGFSADNVLISSSPKNGEEKNDEDGDVKE